MFIDESHVSIPQLRAMYNGDYSRKKNLVEHGFRLPSALDNRPMRFEEFEKAMNDGFVVSNSKSSYSDSSSEIVSSSLSNNSSSKIGEDSKFSNNLYKNKNETYENIKSLEQKHTNNFIMSKQKPSSEKNILTKKLTTVLDNNLSSFYQNQNETLKVHQKYLDQQAEYSRTVLQFLEKQIELATEGKKVPDEVDSQMRMFHTHQSETLRVHENYLNQQSQQSQTA